MFRDYSIYSFLFSLVMFSSQFDYLANNPSATNLNTLSCLI